MCQGGAFIIGKVVITVRRRRVGTHQGTMSDPRHLALESTTRTASADLVFPPLWSDLRKKERDKVLLDWFY